MTCLTIVLPRGDENLLTKLFLAEKRMEPAFPMTFEVKNGKTYRIWHIGEKDAQVASFVPPKLEWEWTTEYAKEEPFEDF